MRLADISAFLSLGTDLGSAQPMEDVIRQTPIALRLPERVSSCVVVLAGDDVEMSLGTSRALSPGGRERVTKSPRREHGASDHTLTARCRSSNRNSMRHDTFGRLLIAAIVVGALACSSPEPGTAAGSGGLACPGGDQRW